MDVPPSTAETRLHVGVVIVQFCDPMRTRECLEALIRAKGSWAMSVTLVNNGLDPGPVCEFEGVSVRVISTRNHGYAAAVNAGVSSLASCQCSHLLVMNNDVSVEVDCLVELIRAVSVAELPAVVSPLIVQSESRRVWYSGGGIGRRLSPFHEHFGDHISQVSAFEKRVTLVTGAIFLVGMDTFHAIGMMREEYFLYWEDVDYSLRAIQHGVEIIVVPKAVAAHDIRASTGSIAGISNGFEYLNARNRLWLMRRVRHVPLAAYLYSPVYCLRLILSARTRGDSTFRSFLRVLLGTAVGMFARRPKSIPPLTVSPYASSGRDGSNAIHR